MSEPVTLMRPLAMFGGTFDPVHLGHLRAAWEAAELLDADVHLVPARVPPHRPQPVASVDARVALLRASLAGQECLQLDTRELARDGPSYSVDTLADLRCEFGAARPLVLLVGADAFAGLASWHRWHELFALAHIGVLRRPGATEHWPQELRDERKQRRCNDPAELRATPAGRIIDLPITPLDISASAIRTLLATGREPRYLMAAAALRAELLAPYRAGSVTRAALE